jgi:hypothetical protein
MSNSKVTCDQCQYYTPSAVGGNGDCTQWDSQIKQGVSVQQNALFYREQLGGDSLYSNCEFLADEYRNCRVFAGRYAFVVGD